jgi:ABC-2 type transport system permease protein
MTRPDLAVVRALVARDLLAVRRSPSVLVPMLAVPAIVLVVLPALVGLAARAADPSGVSAFLASVPAGVAEPILDLPERERLIVLVNGYLLAPLFLIVPLMVSSVLAADAFAGERERRTLETLLHLPVGARDLFLAKVAGAFLPAVVLSWAGFAVFAVIANGIAWPVMGRVFLPTALWLVLLVWVGPAVAAVGLGLMVRISARARSAQGANQVGSAVVLPVILVAAAQSTGLLLVSAALAVAAGAVLWVVAVVLVVGGARRYTRDRLAASV